MTEPTTLISLRLPSELVQKLDSEAAAMSRPDQRITRTNLITGLVRDHYGVAPVDAAAQEAMLMDDDPGQMPFKCPGVGCNLRTGSKAAVCPTHGRKVVPV